MHNKWMKEALKQAKKAYQLDEVPIGAVIVYENKIIARGYNKRESKQQAISHAEIEAITKASRKMKSWRLENCDLYVTLEPCAMCAGAIMQSRIRSVYFGASDMKGGVLGSLLNLYHHQGFNHYPRVVGNVMQEECAMLLTEFFQKKRQAKKQAKMEMR